MTWTAITDTELTAGGLVLASTWKKLVDNPQAVVSGDLTTPAGERILIDSASTPPASVGVLVATPSSAALVTENIFQAAPFYVFDTAGISSWNCPVSAWYDLKVWGGGAGGTAGTQGWAPDGGYARAMAYIEAGVSLHTQVGPGGAPGAAGNESSLTTFDSSITIIADGGPAFTTDAPNMPTRYVTILGATVLTVQPGMATNLGFSSAGAGCGGAASSAGTRGLIIIERMSYGI